MVSDRAFIFHIHVYVPWGKTLFILPKSMSRSNIKVTVFENMAWLRGGGGVFVFHNHILFQTGFADNVIRIGMDNRAL